MNNIPGIISDLLSGLDYDAPVADIRLGTFQTAVRTRGCGLASTPHESGPHHRKSPVKDAGSLLEVDSRALAGLALSSSLLEATIGMATINSLLKVDESRCQELNAGDLIARKSENKNTAIIGHFPFVDGLRKSVKELWVIEKSPREGDHRESEAEKLVPRADVIGITGMAFTNHTIEHLLGLCRPDAYVVVLGGTTPLSPVLFEYGVDAVSGTLVVEPETVLWHVSQGSTFRQLRGVRLLTMLKEDNQP